MKLGIAGRLTEATIRSPLTPLLLLAAIALGLFYADFIGIGGLD